ncbi:MAG: DUF6320 domain-containing protein [Oscillospiraceae bacterium]|nr:DUF6320 domain-containing protein [Oscillospiraceae bacterium]
MKTCEKCAVSVSGGFEKCPLCQNTLINNINPTDSGEQNSGCETEPEAGTFPFVPLAIHKHSLLFRMMQLCSAFIVIASFTVNLSLPQSGLWSLFVVAGVACVWLSLAVAIRKRHNILKNLTYQVTIVTILSVLWDVFTGWRGWSVDFVIPIAFVSAMAAPAVLARILKMQTGIYIIYSFLLILYGIIPAVFVVSGLSVIIYPSLICVACSLFLFSALMIFEGRNMIEELKRRLHL